jgi:hypothetical protein
MDLTQRTQSNLSELESLSDSDWLDIISSAASEDDDGFDDSDREDANGRPFSRHSCGSVASSSDEVVEGWEGLIEDSADETPFAGPDRAADYTFIPVDDVQRDGTSSPEHKEDLEDERVKAALDQSMMSTLSSSRSNSLANSMQTSIVHSTRSLRLSFPDPTTSRLDSMNSSYEHLTSSDANPPTTDDIHESPSVHKEVTEPSLEVANPEQALTVREDVSVLALPTKPIFEIYLYGSPLVSKAGFVDMLLEKWALGSGLIATKKFSSGPRTVTCSFKSFERGCIVTRTISVVDRTGLDYVGSAHFFSLKPDFIVI